MTHTNLGNILWGIIGADRKEVKKLLDIIPTGIVITADTSCREVIHNAAAAEFLRIQPLEGDPYKSTDGLPAKLYHHGKALTLCDMPLNRSAWKGKKVKGFEIDYIWDDGVHKTAIWSTCPLFDEKGSIIGAAASFEDITRRKQDEEALRQSEDRYHALVTASLDVVYRMSPDWRVMYFLRGRDFIPDTCSPNNTWIDRYVHPDDQPRITQIINEAIRTKSIFELIHRVQHVDDTLGWTFSRAVPILDEAGEIIEWFGVAKDITVHKEEQEKLAFQSHVLSSIHDAVIAANENLIITYWNRMAEKMFGWTEKEAIGEPFQGLLKMIIPSSTWDDLLAKTIMKGCFTGEVIHHHKDGRKIYGESHARVIKDPDGECKGYVASLRNITERKRMEQALQESEKKYRHLFNSIDEGFCIIEVLFDEHNHPFDYRILEVNQAYQQQTGLVDPVGRCMRDMAPDHEQHWFDIFGNIALTGKPTRFQQPARALGRFYDVYAFPTGKPEQRRVGVIFHDIKSRKQAETELKKAHDHLEAKVAERTRELSQERQRLFDILETLPISICLLDADYRIPFANRAFREMFGQSNGRRCYDYIYGFSKPCWFCQTYKVMETGKPLRWKSKTPRGHIDVYDYPFIDTNGADLVLEMSFDITEQENAIKALHQPEERFAKIFHHSPVLLAIIRMRDNVFIDVNQKFTDTMEYARQEVLGQTPVNLNIWAGDSSQTKSLLKLQEKGVVTNFEYKLRTKSGKIITILLSTATIELNGELCRISLMKDITGEKKLETEMARLDRLNLVGEMAAGIGHEVRNPMTTVRGFLQLLGEREKYAQDKGYFTLMIDELDRANSIISEFLSLARDRAVHLEMKDLNKILHSILPLIQADGLVTDKYIELKTLKIPALLLDEKEIRQLVLNLVRNGMQAMVPGQTLTMETFVEENKEGNKIVLTVRDQGTGIPPEIADKIGNPFFTTKDSGTGLGLSVCYSIAARHKAAIDFETSPTGTTFFVRFAKPL